MAKSVARPRRKIERVAEKSASLFVSDDPHDDAEEVDLLGRASYTASLLTQGNTRFYTLSMPSDVLAETCMVEPRNEDPIEGFQRALDTGRAKDIARYIDSGTGTIPSSIVLSAQVDAELQYKRTTRTLSFNRHPKSFLILDGQHRVYGFSLASSTLRVPVVIYNGLTRTEEARLFMDINTKQRPVPNELILDIKRLADTESNTEGLLRDVFDAFDKNASSPLLGLMSPSERKKGKISRVTFNRALKNIYDSFADEEADYVYDVLSSYMQACLSGLRAHKVENQITNPTVFYAIMMLFPNIAERVADRHDKEFTVGNFSEIVGPVFGRIKRNELSSPGKSPTALYEIFKKALKSGFTIRRG